MISGTTLILSSHILLHCPVHLRDLLSFPTRRSSDLISNEALRKAEGFVEQEEGAANRLIGWAGIIVTVIDRKSTRLNSSHVRISYAVFCLKKKKIDGLDESVTNHNITT